MLKVENLTVHYGGIQALKGISFTIQKGSIVALIGSNGAGKTSTLRAISGIVKCGGKLIFDGIEINGMSTEKIVGSGLIHVPEGRRIFTDLTVEENLMMGAYLRKDRENFNKDMDYVYDLFPRLKERKRQAGGTLSGGEQQMLAVGRAILSKPKLLMLDEPSMGLAPLVIRDIFEAIGQLRDNGLTVLLVEQNANIALRSADYAYVMETGTIELEGAASELLSDDRVRKAYLGEE